MKNMLTFLIIILVYACTFTFILPINVCSQEKLSIDSGVITGEYKIPDCPEWLNTAVMYQIYPQTFFDTDADGIGDLEGIIQKLDYVKSLGVDGFWINPFFESPFHDAGYDVSDYYKTAPRYGTNEDAKRMFDEAEKPTSSLSRLIYKRL
ncbi:MAG: alpha-amylase family glycosyl hydrolase [Calditrichaceae bacterium]